MQVLYQFEDREAILAAISANGQLVLEDVTVDLDPELLEQGIQRPTNCYFITRAAPAPTEPTIDPRIAEFEALVAQQDNKILDLTYENILLQEGLL